MIFYNSLVTGILIDALILPLISCQPFSMYRIPSTDYVVASATVCYVQGNKNLSGKGTAGMYGMVAKIPDRAVVDEFILQFFDQVYKL